MNRREFIRRGGIGAAGMSACITVGSDNDEQALAIPKTKAIGRPRFVWFPGPISDEERASIEKMVMSMWGIS